MGTNYIEVEVGYGDGPQLYSAGTSNGAESEGKTYVEGWYFSWELGEPGGFSGSGWWGAGYGPLETFSSDDEVEEYVTRNGNLDICFQQWQQTLSNDPENAFSVFVAYLTLFDSNTSSCATQI